MEQEPQTPPLGHEQAECPKCGHKFWHKIGHAIKDVAKATIETAVEVSLPPNFGGSGD